MSPFLQTLDPTCNQRSLRRLEGSGLDGKRESRWRGTWLINDYDGVGVGWPFLERFPFL